jgi:hypothetical protein
MLHVAEALSQASAVAQRLLQTSTQITIRLVHLALEGTCTVPPGIKATALQEIMAEITSALPAQMIAAVAVVVRMPLVLTAQLVAVTVELEEMPLRSVENRRLLLTTLVAEGEVVTLTLLAPVVLGAVVMVP